MRRSADWSRASSVPQMWMRGSAPAGRVTETSAISVARNAGSSAGATASRRLRLDAGEQRRERLAAGAVEEAGVSPSRVVGRGGGERIEEEPRRERRWR